MWLHEEGSSQAIQTGCCTQFQFTFLSQHPVWNFTTHFESQVWSFITLLTVICTVSDTKHDSIEYRFGNNQKSSNWPFSFWDIASITWEWCSVDQLSPSLTFFLASSLMRGMGKLQTTHSTWGGPIPINFKVKTADWKKQRKQSDLCQCKDLISGSCLVA